MASGSLFKTIFLGRMLHLLDRIQNCRICLLSPIYELRLLHKQKFLLNVLLNTHLIFLEFFIKAIFNELTMIWCYGICTFDHKRSPKILQPFGKLSWIVLPKNYPFYKKWFGDTPSLSCRTMCVIMSRSMGFSGQKNPY